MKTNITVITEMLKQEIEEYKKGYDGIQIASERELKEVNDNYKPGSKLLTERVEQIRNACDTSLARSRVKTADRALKDIEELRQQELQRVQTVNEPLLAKIRAIANIPMTTAELKAFTDKINARGDYWAGRMLADIAERNGIEAAEIGIESTLDTKMSILDQLADQLNRVLKFYGTNNPEERITTNYGYRNATILERAKQMYGGKVGKLSDSQKADKAYFTVRTQQTDIQQGIAISNVLRNVKGEVRNMILCRLAEDNSISSMAAEFSGHMDEIADFKNGKAAEYRAEQKALQNIRKTRNKAAIEQMAGEQGITIERVRQIKEKGLRKLKTGRARRELRKKFDIAEAGLYRGGLNNYREHNFTSIVERTAMKEIEAEERYKQHLAEIEEHYKQHLKGIEERYRERIALSGRKS